MHKTCTSEDREGTRYHDNAAPDISQALPTWLQPQLPHRFFLNMALLLCHPCQGHLCPLHKLRSFVSQARSSLPLPDLPAHSPSVCHPFELIFQPRLLRPQLSHCREGSNTIFLASGDAPGSPGCSHFFCITRTHPRLP